MRGTQCDTCRVFAAAPAAGWLVVTVAGERSSVLFPQPPEVLGTFCSARCAAEFLYALAVIKETNERA